MAKASKRSPEEKLRVVCRGYLAVSVLDLRVAVGRFPGVRRDRYRDSFRARQHELVGADPCRHRISTNLVPRGKR